MEMENSLIKMAIHMSGNFMILIIEVMVLTSMQMVDNKKGFGKQTN